jgi:hypothetical protein
MSKMHGMGRTMELDETGAELRDTDDVQPAHARIFGMTESLDASDLSAVPEETALAQPPMAGNVSSLVGGRRRWGVVMATLTGLAAVLFWPSRQKRSRR